MAIHIRRRELLPADQIRKRERLAAVGDVDHVDTGHHLFWVDGIHVQARLEDDAQCLLVIIGATPEGKKGFGRPHRRRARERTILDRLARISECVACFAFGARRLLQGSTMSPRAGDSEAAIQRAVFQHLALRGASDVFADRGRRPCQTRRR